MNNKKAVIIFDNRPLVAVITQHANGYEKLVKTDEYRISLNSKNLYGFFRKAIIESYDSDWPDYSYEIMFYTNEQSISPIRICEVLEKNA